ncbi:MAG: AAA family ATPase, partial [Chitinophagaceae bacterium]
ADINIQSEAELSDQYEKVADAFNALRNSNKIWDITSEAQSNDIKSAVKSTVTRQEVQFSLKDIDFIKCSEPAFFLENANGSHFYIYPVFVLLMDKNENFNLLDLKNLEFKFNRRRFIEEKNSIPSDSKIIDNIWAKVNKDGSPDLRFRGNYQTPVVNYGVLNFNIKEELNEVYNISNCEASELFAEEFLTYLALLKNDIGVAGNTVTKQYFDIVKEFGDKFISFIIRIQNDKKFIDKIYKIQSVKEQPFNNSTELIRFMFDRDLIICFGLIADISNLHSKEAFALLYIVAKMNGLDVNGYTAISVLYGENMLKAYVGMCKVINEEIQQPNNDLIILKFSLLLSAYDADLQKEYLANLYRFASIVVKADGKVTEEEQEALKKILNISEQNSKLQLDFEHNQLVERKASDTPPSIPALNKALVELDSLIGLSAVKAEVKSLINFIKIQKAREVTGLKSSSLSYHLVFTGNPGTGKTTVARIISEIYKNLGVLLEGQLIETDRSGLVAEYVGQTAIKVNKVVESALNGTLFIDEAYSLVGANRDDFGKEAVATLIKRMEDNREKLVVIIAGYTNEMREFIDTNPGFKSRFNRYIEFADYTPDELLSIYKLSCSKLDYTLTKEAEGKLFNLIVHAVDKKDNSFGNGRFVRNILEKTLEKQANRIANISSLTTEILTTITLEDIPEYSF